MYRLKVKTLNEQPIVFNFNTLQEVAEHISKFCNAANLSQVLKFQKEFNVRFYLSYKKGEN